jgi:hypothetical protein
MHSRQLLGVQERHDVSDQRGKFIPRGGRLRRRQTTPCQSVHTEAATKGHRQVVERCGSGTEPGQKNERITFTSPVQVMQSDSVCLDEVFGE